VPPKQASPALRFRKVMPATSLEQRS
jgi:hypothetical protein